MFIKDVNPLIKFYFPKKICCQLVKKFPCKQRGPLIKKSSKLTVNSALPVKTNAAH